MFHLLVTPLVLIDPLYTTGLAGTIVNGLATGGICVILYRLMGEKKLGILSSVLFMSNISTLIYGATPMTEQTAIFFTVLATYYFKRYWEKDDLTEFMKCSLALIFGTLTRYEVWAVAFLVALFFLIKEFRERRFYRLAYVHLPFWGIFAWFFWNLAIFRDPLYFRHFPRIWAARTSPWVWSFTTTLITSTAQLTIMVGYAWTLSIAILVFYALKHKINLLVTSMLLLSPIPFAMVTGLTGNSLLWDRHFYPPLVGLLSTPLLLKRKKIRSIVLVSFIILYAIAIPTQITIFASGKSICRGPVINDRFIIDGSKNFPFVTERKVQMDKIKKIVGNQVVLYHNSWFFSVLTGTSPRQIIDCYDQEYASIMVEPWTFNVPFVVIQKMSLGDMEQTNNLYNRKFYIYQYFNNPDWKNKFLSYYTLVSYLPLQLGSVDAGVEVFQLSGGDQT